MGTLGIINSEPEIKELVEAAFCQDTSHDFDLIFLAQEDEVLEFINYSLPEFLVINFSDPNINIKGIIDHITNDKWIFNLGIIGLFSGEKDVEGELLKKYKALNVLTLLDSGRLRSHLVKSAQIIEQNYQLIFHWKFTERLMEGVSGSFIIDNNILAVLLYSGIGATILAQRGLINPDNKMHLQLALSELIVNAVEHGNCGISFEEKSQALASGISAIDLITEKCKDPVINARKVFFDWEIKQDKTIFTIRDEGAGFDVKSYLQKLKNVGKDVPHGRGIRMAAGFSSGLKYNSKGNKVQLTINHDATAEMEIPAGFSGEQVIHVKKGDIVIREGESGDSLYYISSGTYDVTSNGKKVGSLSPQDIFMGEMSFLLNKRRSATIKAASEGKLIFLPQKNFMNVIREYPYYGMFLSKLIAKRLLRSNEQAAN